MGLRAELGEPLRSRPRFSFRRAISDSSSLRTTVKVSASSVITTASSFVSGMPPSAATGHSTFSIQHLLDPADQAISLCSLCADPIL